MGTFHRDLTGGSSFYLDFFPTAALAAGVPVMLGTVAQGEVTTATTTSAADMMGVTQTAVTYDATPTTEPNNITQDNLCRVIANPLAVWRFKISGGAAAGTALVAAGAASGSTGSHILVQDTASATVIADVSVGTITMAGGLVKGRTGTYAGAIRKLTAHSDNVSTTHAIGWTGLDAVGDTYIRVPYSRGTATVTLCTELTEANGLLELAGAELVCIGVKINELTDEAWVDVVAGNHVYNPA